MTGNPRTWALALIEQLTSEMLPEYGSEQWRQSSEQVRRASAVRAAEAWRESRDPHRLAVAVEAELEAFRRHEERDYAGWRALALKVRADADAPTHAELLRRRAS